MDGLRHKFAAVSQFISNVSDWLQRYTVYAFLILTVFTFCAVFYIYYYISHRAKHGSTLGPLGDFFGGFANPLLAFVTIVGLLLTLHMQHRTNKAAELELMEAKKAAKSEEEDRKKRDFESTFFQLLNLQNNIVNEIRINTNDGPLIGRMCFEKIYGDLLNYCGRHTYLDHDHASAFDAGYDDFWAEYRNSLGHYYRTLYNTFRFLDNSFRGDRQLYAKFLRAQLSDYELIVMYFNIRTNRGAKFLRYARKYDIMDNLPEEFLTRNKYAIALEDRAKSKAEARAKTAAFK